MGFQFATNTRNAWLDAIETAIGASPTLELRSGSIPANYAAAATGTLLASMTLPADWMAAASGGSKAMSGTWQDAAADAGGTVGYFRIIGASSNGIQGTVTITGGGGDMTLDNNVVTLGQQVTVTAFALNAGGA